MIRRFAALLGPATGSRGQHLRNRPAAISMQPAQAGFAIVAAILIAGRAAAFICILFYFRGGSFSCDFGI